MPRRRPLPQPEPEPLSDEEYAHRMVASKRDINKDTGAGMTDPAGHLPDDVAAMAQQAGQRDRQRQHLAH